MTGRSVMVGTKAGCLADFVLDDDDTASFILFCFGTSVLRVRPRTRTRTRVWMDDLSGVSQSGRGFARASFVVWASYFYLFLFLASSGSHMHSY
jgi:hypothetical protein